MFLPAFNDHIKSDVVNYQFSLTFLQMSIFLTQNKIPRPGRIFSRPFPDLWKPCKLSQIVSSPMKHVLKKK